eukprot:jgi/Picsp_1/1407/NSC_04886-R1_acyl carrier protein
MAGVVRRSLAAVRQSVLAQMRLMNESSPAVCGSARQQMDSIAVDSNASIGSVIAASKQMVRFFAGDSSYLDKQQVTDRVLNVVKNFDKVEQSKITPTAKFQQDLGLDSLDSVELVMAIEEEFAIEIPDSEADKILSCEDAISYISANPMAK